VCLALGHALPRSISLTKGSCARPDAYDVIAVIPQSTPLAEYGAFHRIVQNRVRCGPAGKRWSARC